MFTIAATGPPPAGPCCNAATEQYTIESPIAAAATPPTTALVWCVWWMSESLSDTWRRPRTRPVGSVSHLMKQLTSAPPMSVARARSGSGSPAMRIAS